MISKHLSLSLFIAIAAVGLHTTVIAQKSFWSSKDAYLGQVPPAETPKIFAPERLIDSGIVLGRIAFSGDGKQFYYGFARHWFDFKGTGVKEMIFDGEKWTAPKIIVHDLATPTL